MYTIFKTGIILCLVITCWCDGDTSGTEPVREVRQEQPLRTSFSAANLMRAASSQSLFNEGVSHTTPSYEAAIGEGCNEDVACLTLASHDRIGLEAIRSLHRQLDDDANGNIDLSESDEFLREELKYQDGYERRQKAFHYNDDNHISVRELWEAWIRSEVHNWTVEQTSEWLASNVELPQYTANFLLHRVTGAMLPRLAVNNMHYLSNVLGIKDPIHKQKIALKAMDVVLFGPPKDTGHFIKDLILVTALLLALTGCYYAYRKTKSSQNDVRRMLKHMESLRKAEYALDQLQKELEKARMEQEYVTTEKQNLEKLLEQGGDNLELRTSSSDLEVSQLKAEIEMLRGELKRAEGELEDRCWSPPVGLQQWLQLTHEIENKSYIKKRLVAEKQLQLAREACDKLRKKRSSLVGAFVSTHGKSIDDVDRSIIEARTSLNEVTQELQERVHRWKQIELLCGFNIINNSGLQYLESVLYRGTANGRGGSSMGLRGRMSSSQDDLDDDTSSLYSPSAGGMEGFQWKEGADSSGSETGKGELDDDFQMDSRSLGSNVHFIVGSDSWPDEIGKSRISRSFSQDVGLIIGDRESSPTVSQSETSIDSKSPISRLTSGKKSSPREFTTKESTRDHTFKDISLRDHGSRESAGKDHGVREPPSPHEHGRKESSARDHGPREPSGREHMLREQSVRDHGLREVSGRDHTSRETSGRDHALRESSGRDHALRESSGRDHTPREISGRDHGPRETSGRDHGLRDPPGREHTSRDPPPKDHISKEALVRDHGSRESALKDHTSRELSLRDHNPRETTSRDHGPRDVSIREHVHREYAVKEHLIRDASSRDTSKDAIAREIASRDLAIQERAARELALVPYERFTKEHFLRDHVPKEMVPPPKEPPATSKAEQSVPMEEETYSTDSNSTTEEDIRRKKRKLFPTFNRKHKTKNS